jgi:putative transposase
MHLAGVPCHVVQRGNNRDACRRNHVDVHAYVLMTNPVHLLLTPQPVDGVSRVMQPVGRHCVQ